MEDLGTERIRSIPAGAARALLAEHLIGSPPLLDELELLTAGKIGVQDAIVRTVGDELSYDPSVEITAPYIRGVLGAPEDNSELDEWRLRFWDAYKSKTSSE